MDEGPLKKLVHHEMLGRGIWAGEFQPLGIGMSEAGHSFAPIPLSTFAGV
jgi:hypothetical protein